MRNTTNTALLSHFVHQKLYVHVCGFRFPSMIRQFRLFHDAALNGKGPIREKLDGPPCILRLASHTGDISQANAAPCNRRY